MGKGTGLGLSTVYGIVKQTGGFIWAYSEPGLGTSFKIYLPRADREMEEAPQREAAQVPACGSETILLVEDEEIVREVTREILEHGGYTVIEARSGEEALLLSGREGAIQLMLTDLIMPGMTGRELAERISAQRPGIRILYASGYTDDVILKNGMLEPGMDFIEKPFSTESLSRKVRDVLDAPPREANAAADDPQGREREGRS